MCKKTVQFIYLFISVISDIEVKELSYNLVWVSFQINGVEDLPLPSPPIVTTNPWVDQFAVCSALKWDTFTFLNFYESWLNYKIQQYLLLQNTKPIFHEKLLKMLYFFSDSPSRIHVMQIFMFIYVWRVGLCLLFNKSS